jgi:hypothetical protein
MVLEQDLFSKLQCKKEMKLFHMKLSSDGQQFKAKSNKANSHLSAQIIEQTKRTVTSQPKSLNKQSEQSPLSPNH